MDSTILTDPFIWVYDNVIPNNKCREIINRFEADNRQHQGMTAGGVQKNVKNSLDLFVTDLNDWKDIDDLFKDLIQHLIIQYSTHLKNSSNLISFTENKQIPIAPALTSNVRDVGYQIQKTNPNDGYVWHSDYEIGRILTFILYLNTVEEGWTQFYNGDQVSPQAGRCVMFPATWTYYHQGYPPKQTKYIMTGWVYSDR